MRVKSPKQNQNSVFLDFCNSNIVKKSVRPPSRPDSRIDWDKRLNGNKLYEELRYGGKPVTVGAFFKKIIILAPSFFQAVFWINAVTCI